MSRKVIGQTHRQTLSSQFRAGSRRHCFISIMAAGNRRADRIALLAVSYFLVTYSWRDFVVVVAVVVFQTQSPLVLLPFFIAD